MEQAAAGFKIQRPDLKKVGPFLWANPSPCSAEPHWLESVKALKLLENG